MTSVFDEPKPSDDNPHESKIVINGNVSLWSHSLTLY